MAKEEISNVVMGLEDYHGEVLPQAQAVVMDTQYFVLDETQKQANLIAMATEPHKGTNLSVFI